MLLVKLLILPGEVPHVVGDVAAEDVGTVQVGVQLLGLVVVAGETLLGVGDVQSAFNGSPYGGENLQENL